MDAGWLELMASESSTLKGMCVGVNVMWLRS